MRRHSGMATLDVKTAGYGSLAAFSAVHRPARRKKILSIVLAVASILLCTALVSLGNSQFFGMHHTGRSSELLVTEPAHQPTGTASSPHQPAQVGRVENWGNQTPTAMIYARHSPVRDGVVDFYLKFPTGSSKLRAPKWFMGIPLRRNSAAVLKQVETAFLDGQITQIPAARTRKLMGIFGSIKKFAKKAAPGKTAAKGAKTANPSGSMKGSGKASVKPSASGKKSAKSSDSIGSSNSKGSQKPVDCCLPDCARGKLPNQFNSAKGCGACKTTPEKNQCTNVLSGKFQWKVCKTLRTFPIKKGDIVPQLFDPGVCKIGGALTAGGVPSPPPPPSIPPLPVPSCAMDKNSKFAGCSACADPKQFPAADGRICSVILSKHKPGVGVTPVTRDDSLRDPNPPKPPAPVPGGGGGGSGGVKSGGSSLSSKKQPKMCSHDPTKLNGNGQGCATCQGKVKTAATQDLPGNDYWACSQCRDKGVCDFNCKLNPKSKVWECTQGNPGKAPPPPMPEPQCVADKKLNWKAASNEMRCQGYMCKKAGLQPSGEFGPLPYPKLNGHPKKLDAKTCCPFVAQGLTQASCHQKFGCDIPSTMTNGKTEWGLNDQVKSCKNFFCLNGVSSPAEWAQKSGDSKFADGINKGRSACCAKMLATVPDGKESWCSKAIVDPNCKGPDCKLIVDMDEGMCQDFLCQQTPMISNVGESYALWLEHSQSSGSRRLLQAAAGTKSASKSASSNKSPELDPNVARCVRKLQLSGIDTWQTNSYCVKDEDKIEEEEDAPEEEEKTGGEGGKGDDEAKGHGGTEEGKEAGNAEHEGEKEEQGLDEPKPELEKEEIPEAECDEENGPENLPILPGANVLGYTYDPQFGLQSCNFDRCVIRPFIKYTYKDCKVVETPAGQFKVPDQIHAHNLYQTSAQTKIYENERERQNSEAVSAKVEGSYAFASGSVSTDYSSSGSASSKQHIAIRKIDVHLYRLTLLNTKSFDSLRPEFLEAFKMLPARFEDNAHDYIQFLRNWGRYVPVSGTFGGSVEIKMKFLSSSSASKTDISAGVEASVDIGLFSASASASTSFSNEAKEVENNNEVSIDSSGGDPAIASAIADLKSTEEMSFRDDLEKWLESVPKYPRLIEDVPIMSVMTHFIPNSPTEDGGFDPFTRNQGLLQAMRILHEDGATSLFDKRKCYPPLPPPDVKQLPVAAAISIPPSKVRIFQHCNYVGHTLAFSAGDYDTTALYNPGGYDFVKQISSLQIQKGTQVILYSQPGFRGETLVLNGNTDCLVAQNFNDVPMSMKILTPGEGEIKSTGNARKRKPLPSGRDTISFNDFDRMHVGQCISFVAETSGDINLYLFSSPVSQVDAYSFVVGTKQVKLEKGLYAKATVLKQTSDTNALAYGQASLPQNVWFCIYPDSEDSSATVFSYGRGSYTLFQYTETVPVLINYFALDCTLTSTYRSILVIKASRWLDTVNPFNRICAIVNCQKVQETESESGICACEQCDFGYQPRNNNQECVVADQCPAQFGCMSANPPDCACEECCCGLSYDPVTQNCVNANLNWKAGSLPGDNIAIVQRADYNSDRFGSHSGRTNQAAMTNKMETKFKVGGSYRMKKLMFSCTENAVQNIRISYDASKPALGFIDYDSTHLVTKSDTAGKFDFSIYDNLRKSVEANPLFSASGFLNLDEVKLEEVTLASMAKKSGNALQDMFKFVVEGAKQFAKGVDEAAQKVGKVVEDVKNQAEKVVNELKNKTEELMKVADGEVKKFMKVAEKAYKDVVAVAQKVTQGAVDFVAQNADLLKTVTGIAGGIGAGLVSQNSSRVRCVIFI